MTQKYYILLAFLPADLIKYIYMINLKNQSVNTIIRIFNHQQIKQKILKRFVKLFCRNNNISNNPYNNNNIYNPLSTINNSLDTTNYITFKNELELIAAELKYIRNANYNRERYNYQFWQYFLTLISNILMRYNIFIDNIPTALLKIPNKLKNKLNKCIQIWYELCTKHNIKLAVLLKNKALYNDYVYISTRQVGPLFDFNRFMIAPVVISNQGEFIDTDFGTLLHVNFIVN